MDFLRNRTENCIDSIFKFVRLILTCEIGHSHCISKNKFQWLICYSFTCCEGRRARERLYKVRLAFYPRAKYSVGRDLGQNLGWIKIDHLKISDSSSWQLHQFNWIVQAMVSFALQNTSRVSTIILSCVFLNTLKEVIRYSNHKAHHHEAGRRVHGNTHSAPRISDPYRQRISSRPVRDYWSGLPIRNPTRTDLRTRYDHVTHANPWCILICFSSVEHLVDTYYGPSSPYTLVPNAPTRYTPGFFVVMCFLIPHSES